MSLTIALDFDRTLTADPSMWHRFVDLAEQCCNRVIIVTARRDTEENRKEIADYLRIYDFKLPVYYTGLASKLWFMNERGVNVDIWIDDDPKTLVNGH